MTTRIYGIRHHGPGSARSLLEALQEQQPDCILLEHPADTGPALQQVATPGLVPPVALLVFDPKVFSRASYYPFTRFSPEWQAMQFAAERNIPVMPMDLPAGIQFLLADEAASVIPLDSSPGEDAPGVERDPLGHLATLAGYTDSERWWESVLEQAAAGSDVFEVLAEMMRTLRHTLQRQESPETLLREAYMRQSLRDAAAAGYSNAAVVCGAWHTPALEQWNAIKSSNDKALLRGRKKTTVQAVWIPWTYERIAMESGYGAGVLSPAWYELLFEHPAESTQRWMVQAARLMRDEDIDISTAHVMEAVRLADTLATLRLRAVAGVEDMEEAALSVFFLGNREGFRLIRSRLVIGEVMGSVPDALTAAPLQRDLEQEIRSARLSKEYASLESVFKTMDLRTDTQLRASRLLHRLLLLDVPWGERVDREGGTTGTFKESWKLKWLPDYTLRVVQAGLWGNTVATAALNCVLDRCRRTESLPELSDLAWDALRADLPDAVSALVQKLENASALAKDVHLLLDTLPGLVQMARYGNVRKTDAEAVKRLVGHFIPRIALGLPAACLQLDDEPAAGLFGKIQVANGSVSLLANAELTAYWLQALWQISTATGAHPLLQGGASRMLFDRSELDEGAAGRRFALALSAGNEAVYSTLWIEGFLYGSGLLLIHYPPLWRLLDDWVSGLGETAFLEALPLLRRAFSAFSGPERQKMLALAAQGEAQVRPISEDDLDEGRLAVIAPTLGLLLDSPLIDSFEP